MGSDLHVYFLLFPPSTLILYPHFLPSRMCMSMNSIVIYIIALFLAIILC